MKKQLFSLLVVISILTVHSQLINVNPDPNGEPWYVGGLKVPGKSELQKIPVIEVSKSYIRATNTVLPDRLDNSELEYFRPIFNQSDGSCSQSSGVAYNFTYEINRERGTSAQTTENQYPSHYTYDFLNGGSGDNGSWFVDGWEIIKANGCPDVVTYGGTLDYGGPTRWISGYDSYETGMNNRVKDNFSIDVGTPEGLDILKHWLYDHLEDASTGGIVNFAAGIENFGYKITDDNIITQWGMSPNHAMTIVGWDDSIEYDYNDDGQITTDMDINGDGIVDMRDWEKGALIMVNSWGTSWGDNGKAYVMYKTLGEPDTMHGGIVEQKVYSIHVKSSQTPQLIMRIKMTHNKRNKIKISAGISTDTNAGTPEETIDFPLFYYQGGEYDMQGINSDPIEISLDISSLLSYINPDTPAKFFLIVNEENDSDNSANGEIIDFSIVNNSGEVTTCDNHNVALNNNTDTILSIVSSVDFEAPVITTDSLPVALINSNYSYTLEAEGGNLEYQWDIIHHYNEVNNDNDFPDISSNQIETDSDDDGYGAQTLDFDFPFYGQFYNEIYLLTDGSLVFEPEFNYIRSEPAIMANKVISVFASDLMIYAEDGDGFFYEGDETHATFRWKTSLYDNQDANVDAAVTLYPNGDIEFFYGDNITPGLDWAAGISDGYENYIILEISNNADPSNQKTKLEAYPYPFGMYLTPEGVFQGTTPNEINSWNIDFKVTDNSDVSSIKTLVFETTDSSEIKEEQLYQLNVYPNPVHETAQFNYHLDQNSKVRLTIFDIKGNKVETVIDKEQRAGTYQILWRNTLATGLYIYELKTEKGTETGKLIIQ